MELARVIGRAVATVKYPTLEGVKLLVLQGGFRDEHGVYREGEFARFEAGSAHEPTALDEGVDCILFAIAQEGIELGAS